MERTVQWRHEIDWIKYTDCCNRSTDLIYQCKWGPSFSIRVRCLLDYTQSTWSRMAHIKWCDSTSSTYYTLQWFLRYWMKHDFPLWTGRLILQSTCDVGDLVTLLSRPLSASLPCSLQGKLSWSFFQYFPWTHVQKWGTVLKDTFIKPTIRLNCLEGAFLFNTYLDVKERLMLSVCV